MNIIFILKEGIINLIRAKVTALISIISIGLALTLIGVFTLVGYNLKNVYVQFYQQIVIEAFLYTSLQSSEIEEIQSTLEKKPPVNSIEYISQAEALKIFQETFGQDLSSVLDEDSNPLPPSLRITLSEAYSHPDSAEKFSRELKAVNGIQEVVYDQDIIRFMHSNFKLAVIIGGILAMLLILVITILVFNTIRLTIHARKNIIEIMRLVGATNLFIKSPFIVEGIIQGVVGGFIAAGLVNLFKNIIEYILLTQFPVHPALLGSVVIMGIFLGLTGSYISVNKYL